MKKTSYDLAMVVAVLALAVSACGAPPATPQPTADIQATTQAAVQTTVQAGVLATQAAAEAALQAQALATQAAKATADALENAPVDAAKLGSALLTPEDLTFAGDYDPAKWSPGTGDACSDTQPLGNSPGYYVPMPDGLLKKARNCWAYGSSDVVFEQALLLFQPGRQASRYGQALENGESTFITELMATFNGTVSQKTLDLDGRSTQIIQGHTAAYNITIAILTLGDLIDFIELRGAPTFVDQDLADLTRASVARIQEAKKP